MPLPAPATYALTIAGVAKSFAQGSLAIAETANGRNTIRLTILSASYRPALDAEVILTENGIRIFGGTINGTTESGHGRGTIAVAVSAADFNGLAEQQHVPTQPPAGTLKAFLTAMLAYLPGVTLDPAQVTGPTIPEVPVYYDKVVRDMIGQACALAGGYVFEIDYNKVLRAFLPSTRAAPFNLIEGDGHAIGDITVEPQRTAGKYANRVVVMMGQGAASTTDNFVANGTATSWTTTAYATTDWPGTVLHNGITEPLGPYEPGNPASAYALQWSSSLHTIFQRAGASPLPSGDTLAITYSGLYPVPIIRDNTPEQTAHGVWDVVIALPETFAVPDAQAFGDAALAAALVVPKIVRYVTEERGLAPGQTQTINLPSRAVNNTFLLTDIQTTNYAGNRIRRSVTAIEGTTYSRSRTDELLKQWSTGGGSYATAVAGGGGGGSSGPGGGRTAYFLGSSGLDGRRNPTPTWISASGGAYQVQLDTVTRGRTSATVTVRVRAAAAGVTIQARLFNVTDNTPCTGVSAIVSGTAWQTLVFGVTLAAGAKFYELQLLPGLANADVFGVGYVE